MLDNVKLTADAARDAGWTVPQTCTPGMGHLGTLSPDYPLQVRYDADGNLAGIVLSSPGPLDWPSRVCPPGGIPATCQQVNFGGPPSIQWQLPIWFRDSANICSPGAGGGLFVTRLSGGFHGEVFLGGLDRNQLEYSTERAWFHTGTCIPRMGTHMVRIPTVNGGTLDENMNAHEDGPSALVFLVDLDGALIGFEFLSNINGLQPYLPPPARHEFTPPPSPPWEVDGPRPDKPFSTFSWHFWWIAQDPSGGNFAQQPSGPQTIDTQCVAGFPPGVGQPFDPRWRAYDGVGNNEASGPNSQVGGSFTPFGRISQHWYGDGTQSMRELGRDGVTPLPLPRLVSNEIFARPTVASKIKTNDMHTYWGMLVTVDMCGTGRSLFEMFSAPAPMCDEFYDPNCQGNAQITPIAVRSTPVPFSGTGAPGAPPVRLPLNEVTSYLDASWLYGAHASMAYTLRAFEGGQLKVSWYPGSTLGINRHIYPNDYKRAGDIRMNKSPPLQSFYVIFQREHNRKAAELAALNPDWDDEELFQHARLWTIALVQAYTSREYLGALLGEPLPPYTGYEPSADPTVLSEFCHLALRYGHVKLNTIFERVDERFEQHFTGNVLLRDNHYHLGAVNQSGIEPVLRGLTAQQQRAKDARAIDDVRQFFALGRYDGEDLMAFNIYRGRETGLPGYNDMRRVVRDVLGAPVEPLQSWAELTDDAQLQDSLRALYGDAPEGLENLDPFVGMAIEPDIDGTGLGPISWWIVRAQLLAARNGDRFWYESLDTVPDGVQWSQDNVTAVYDRKLEDIIEDNSDIAEGSLGAGILFVQSRRLATLVADGEIGFFVLEDQTGDFFEDASKQLSSNYKIWWTMNSARTEIRFQLQIISTGWVGIGFDPLPNTMKGADIYFCRVWTHNGTVEVRDSWALDVGPPRLDQDVPCRDGSPSCGGEQSIWDVSGTEAQGRTTIFFTRALSNDDPWDKDIPYDAEIKVIFAFNPTTDELRYHGPTRSADTFINFYQGPYRVREIDEVSTAVLVIVGILGGIGVLLALFFLVLLAIKTDHFRFASPIFCGLVLFGAIVTYSSIFTLLKDSPNDASCTAFVWLCGVGFVFMFSCLFAKTFRIWRLMSSQSLKAKLITNNQLFVWVGALTAIMIVYLIIWTAVDMPESRYEVTDYDDDLAHYQCETPIGWIIAWVVIFGLFILAGVVFAVLTRNLPEEFNDAAPIAWSMYNMMLVFGGATALGFALEQWQSARILVASFGIFLAITFTICALFGPLTWRMIVQGKDPKTFKSTMGSSGGSSGMSSLGSTH